MSTLNPIREQKRLFCCPACKHKIMLHSCYCNNQHCYCSLSAEDLSYPINPAVIEREKARIKELKKTRRRYLRTGKIVK